MPEQKSPRVSSPDSRFSVGPQLYSEDFHDPALPNWASELESGGTITADRGRLMVDVPGGCTVWFRPALDGPVLIEYEAAMIGRGGPNDRVSDLNCFWMAQDPERPGRLLETPRSGRFADYDTLCTYYVGHGGNGNTTTRFRRYRGQAGDRPLLPENDRYDPADLLRPNVPQTIRLVAFGPLIQYYSDERRLFEMHDPVPYIEGWFGLRTVRSHMEVRQFRVFRLLPPCV